MRARNSDSVSVFYHKRAEIFRAADSRDTVRPRVSYLRVIRRYGVTINYEGGRGSVFSIMPDAYPSAERPERAHSLALRRITARNSGTEKQSESCKRKHRYSADTDEMHQSPRPLHRLEKPVIAFISSLLRHAITPKLLNYKRQKSTYSSSYLPYLSNFYNYYIIYTKNITKNL